MKAAGNFFAQVRVIIIRSQATQKKIQGYCDDGDHD